MSMVCAEPLRGLPEIEPGADLGALISARAASADLRLDAATVVVVAHKAVSKAEGSIVVLEEVQVGERAHVLAATLGKPDPRVIQVVLDQAQEVVRAEHGVLIVRTHHGFVCANGGVDASNAGKPGTLVLLPRDPDDSARRLRARLRELGHQAPAVIITDSFGRAWREGQTDVAIGCAGLAPLEDWCGRRDAQGRELRATCLAVADNAAAAADLARAKDSREPVVFVRGLERSILSEDGSGAAELIRPVTRDLFR